MERASPDDTFAKKFNAVRAATRYLGREYGVADPQIDVHFAITQDPDTKAYRFMVLEQSAGLKPAPAAPYSPGEMQGEPATAVDRDAAMREVEGFLGAVEKAAGPQTGTMEVSEDTFNRLKEARDRAWEEPVRRIAADPKPEDVKPVSVKKTAEVIAFPAKAAEPAHRRILAEARAERERDDAEARAGVMPIPPVITWDKRIGRVLAQAVKLADKRNVKGLRKLQRETRLPGPALARYLRLSILALEAQAEQEAMSRVSPPD